MSDERKKLVKVEVRRRMTALRDTLTPIERERRSVQICEQVKLHVLNPLRTQLKRPLRLCVYAHFRSEASPLALIEHCWEQGDITAAPRILPAGEGMELRKVDSPNHWIPGRWGVPEPDPLSSPLIDRTQPLDVVLVPGLAFNEEGGRLGYGGGYYDRLYEQEIKKGRVGTLWIGFAYSIQVITEVLPIEAHDLKLDGLATEHSISWLRSGG